jgi:predicted DNA-binding transcriptional regulator AlpA
VNIGPRAVGWYEPDIDDLIDARLEGREWSPRVS